MSALIHTLLMLTGFMGMYYAGRCDGEIRGVRYALERLNQKIRERRIS